MVNVCLCVCTGEGSAWQHGGPQAATPQSSPSELADESIPDGSEASRLLDWPQLELERVNSFLTSRLEEIKNTIKDSIRASFSMYDLNLDVNDFPKKAATLEGNHLLSHLNGSTDMQQIDLDLAPLSLGNFKNHLDLVNGWEDAGTVSSSSTTSTTAEGAAGQKDVQRSQTTPNLSKLSRIHSPERGAAANAAAAAAATTTSESNSQGLPQATAKSKEDFSETKNTTAGAAKSKKNKKQQQQQQQQRQEQAISEQSSIKPTKALPANEMHKTNESRVAEMSSGGTKSGSRQQQPQQLADSQRNCPRKAEEGRPSRQAANGAASGLPNAQRTKGDTEVRGGRSEQDSDGKTHPSTHTNGQQQQQQSKGKNKKNKNKGEKSSNAIGKFSVHPQIFFFFVGNVKEIAFNDVVYLFPDDVFLPKDVDPTEMDEIDREVEYFKRCGIFCAFIFRTMI